MDLQIVMPMGGLGQRFSTVGVLLPKPLILVDGRPMFRKALDSFERFSGTKRVIAIVRADADNDFGIGDCVVEASPGAVVIRIQGNTRGAVETVLAGRDSLDPAAPLVVLDCDIAFKSAGYFEAMSRSIAGCSDAVLLSFDSIDPRYSYAQTDGSARVIATAEKIPISKNALMGSYFFARAGDFLDAADRLVAQQISKDLPEYYVSLILNIMLSDGKRVELSKGEFYCFGTPDELENYLLTGLPIGQEGIGQRSDAGLL